MNLFELFATVSLNTTEYERGISEVAKSGASLGQKLKSGLSNAGKSAAKGLAVMTGAVTAAGGALLALEANTEEYRIAQGKLNTAFESAGYSAEDAQNAYRSFYQILGDTDTATEASQLLAKLSLNAEDMSKWTDIAAGVWGTFGDSLPIEGLIESANETAKVGQVTGSLADALNWAGINEDDFNARLAECTTEADKNRLIMDTLTGTYENASDAFYQNNEELIRSRDNQIKIQDSLAKVGEAVSKVKNAFLEEFTPIIADAADKFVNFISNIDADNIAEKIANFASSIGNILPIIAGVISAITALAAAQAALNLVMNANPFVLIATLILGIVTALTTLWKTNEEFREAVTSIWEEITGIFSSAWEGIKMVWDLVQPYFSALWEAIKTIFSVVSEVLGGFFSAAWSAITAIWDAASGYFQNLWNTIETIFSVVEAILSGDFEAAWIAIQEALSGWKDYFSGLWDTVKDIFGNVKEWFRQVGQNLLTGIWNGISDKVAWLKSKVSGVVDTIKGWFTGSDGFDEASPSKWSRNVFRYIMDGGALGIEDGVGGVLRSVKSANDQIKRNMVIGSGHIGFSNSMSSPSVKNGILSNSGSFGTIIVQSVLDGKVIGETAYKYSKNKARMVGA